MTTGAQTLLGAKFYIGTTLSVDYGDSVADSAVKAAADLDTFTEIKPFENYGEAGDEATEVDFNSVGEGRTETFRGTKKGAPHEIVLGLVPSDAGQVALKAAFYGSNNVVYNFKIELNDTPSGSDAEPTTFYFAGKILRFAEGLGDVNNVIKRLVRISRDTRTVMIPASS